MKILHTSDWHLGRLFHNVSLLDDQAHVLEQIIGYAVNHTVDAVLIAGDIFDRAVPPAAAMALLDETLHTLTQTHGIPVILISGNHDSHERLAFGARLLANNKLHILHSIKNSHAPIIITSANGQTAAIYGIPYHTPEQVRALFNIPAKTFDEAHTYLVEQITQGSTTADFAILMSHCFVDGASECESERPLAIGGADRINFKPLLPFNYVALGHLHGQQQRGAAHIRYSGSPLKYSFSEHNHHKAVTLVELTPTAEPAITQLPLIPLHDMRCLTGELKALLEDGQKDPKKHDYLAITLTDQHAILDAMGKLREVYPNVLQLEKTFLHNTQNPAKRTALQNNELAMFNDFFTEITGNPLTPEQTNPLKALLNNLHQNQHNEAP